MVPRCDAKDFYAAARDLEKASKLQEARVVNLATHKERYYSCAPINAVMASYAQAQGDWNTWNYVERYSTLVELGKWHFFCGDWGVKRNASKVFIRSHWRVMSVGPNSIRAHHQWIRKHVRWERHSDPNAY